ncbi:MAG: PQQ-dependent sugar dehydrogenase [Pseudomonadota bacterium]
MHRFRTHLKLGLAACFTLVGCSASDTSADAAAPSALSSQLSLTPVAEGLDYPWGLAFLPGDVILATERAGAIRVIESGALREAPVAGTPEAYVVGQGGYLDIAADPDFASNRTIYLSYSKGDDDENFTAVIKGVLSEDLSELTNIETLFETDYKKSRGLHFGSRFAFMDDGTLLFGLGDGFRYMDEAQSLENHLGTVIRINTDGGAPADNPFMETPGAQPEIFTYGHRNVQGLVVDPNSGVIYAHEHGPKGGDEINILKPGANYGWPVITYGVNYNGTIITNETRREGMEQPIVKWVPSIAPSDMVMYQGDEYAEWSGDLLVSALAGQQIRRIDLEDGAVVSEEIVLKDDGLRFRDISVSPDGGIYVTTDDEGGGVYRLSRAAS